LAPPARPPFLNHRLDGSSCRARRLRGCRSICKSGRRTTFHRGRVGIRRARWTRCCDFYLCDEMLPGGKAMANTWQGVVPWQNHLLDGHDRTSPVGSFPPNGSCLRWWLRASTNHHNWASSCRPIDNPNTNRWSIPKRFPPYRRGGSHFCAPNYCLRFRPAARSPQMLDTSMSHLGFRCVVRSLQKTAQP
jgi:formylglycine-generating enzyme required for sulfatase activity